jgi:hypothetical protein
MMDDIVELMDEDAATAEALSIFEREVGTTGVNTEVRTAGHEKFLKFFRRKRFSILQACSPRNPKGFVPTKSLSRRLRAVHPKG